MKDNKSDFGEETLKIFNIYNKNQPHTETSAGYKTVTPEAIFKGDCKIPTKLPDFNKPLSDDIWESLVRLRIDDALTIAKKEGRALTDMDKAKLAFQEINRFPQSEDHRDATQKVLEEMCSSLGLTTKEVITDFFWDMASDAHNPDNFKYKDKSFDSKFDISEIYDRHEPNFAFLKNGSPETFLSPLFEVSDLLKGEETKAVNSPTKEDLLNGEETKAETSVDSGATFTEPKEPKEPKLVADTLSQKDLQELDP